MFARLLKSRKVIFNGIIGIFLMIFLLGTQSSIWSQGVLDFSYTDFDYYNYLWVNYLIPPPVPAPDFDNLHYRKILSFSENNAQGIAFAYNDIWFLSSCNKIFKYSISGSDPYIPLSKQYIDSISLSKMIQKTGLNPGCYDHIGDIDFYEGMLFVPVRARYKESMCHILIVLDVLPKKHAHT